MLIVIRQYGRPLWTARTRARATLTDRDKARAVAVVNGGIVKLETGYYDVVLTSRPSDPRYDVDSSIEIA